MDVAEMCNRSGISSIERLLRQAFIEGYNIGFEHGSSNQVEACAEEMADLEGYPVIKED